MRTVLRYLVLFAGVFLMINGCNELTSTLLGSNKLQTVSVAELASDGVGSGQFLRVEGGTLSDAFVVEEQTFPWFKSSLQIPLLMEGETATPTTSAPVPVPIVLWAQDLAPAEAQKTFAGLINSGSISGIVSPPATVDYGSWREKGFAISEETPFLLVGEKPQSWPVSLLWFLGGLAIAAASEARVFYGKR